MSYDNVPIWQFSGGEEGAANLLFGGVALLALVYCVRVARRQNQLWPVWVFAGSALLVAYEPFNNFLANCTYPENQTTVISYLGRDVPLFIWFVYMFYFSFAVPFLVQKFEQGITMRTLAKYYAVVISVVAAFEPLFCNRAWDLQWWYYFGADQPLRVLGFPMWWWVANSMIVVTTAAIVFLLKKHVFAKGWQTVGIVPIVPLALFGVHGSAAIPVYIATKTGSSEVWTTIASLGTMALSAFYLFIFAKAVCVRRPRTDAAMDPVAEPERALAGV